MKNEQQFIVDTKASEVSNKAEVNTINTEYENKQQELYDEIDSSNTKLTSLIVNNLYNPNAAPDPGSGEVGPSVTETKYVNDKTLNCISEDFVINGTSVTLVGAVGKGLGIGTVPAYNAEFNFKNPDNDGFPSYYINDILPVSDSADKAFISTNNGLIDYDLSSGTYVTRDNTYGLPNKKVIKCIKVKTDDGTQKGYLAATAGGVAYSPTGKIYVQIDSTFDSDVLCLSKYQTKNAVQTKVFIGTNYGLYFVDINDFVKNGTNTVNYLKAITEALPSSYINAILYDSSTDILYIATNGGVSVIKGISSYLSGKDYTSTSFKMTSYTYKSGLSSNTCLDIDILGSEVIVGTSNGLSLTKDFINFSYVTKKTSSTDTNGLNAYMCKKIVKIDASRFNIIHTVGFTEGITL